MAGDAAQRLAEQVTVGTLLLDPGRVAEVAGWLSSDDFADPVCAATYQVISELTAQGRSAEPGAVLEELTRRRVRGVEAVDLIRLIEKVPVPASLPAYGRLVVEGAITRSCQAAGTRIVQIAGRGGDPDDLVRAAVTQLGALAGLPARWQRTRPPGPIRLGHVLPLVVEDLATVTRDPGRVAAEPVLRGLER